MNQEEVKEKKIEIIIDLYCFLKKHNISLSTTDDYGYYSLTINFNPPKEETEIYLGPPVDVNTLKEALESNGVLIEHENESVLLCKRKDEETKRI